MHPREVARETVERVATASGLTALGRRLGLDTVTILAYHNVVQDSEAGRGDRGLHLPLSAFLRQLDRLSKTHEVVALDSVGSSSRGERPRAVVTFDDAYRGAVTVAVPELVRRRMPAVMFVSPSLLGSASTWWDEMAEAGLLSDERRESALRDLGGRGDRVRAWAFPAGGAPTLPASYGIAGAEEVRENCTGLVAVGSHTWSHEHLPSLDSTELDRSLRRTIRWLEDQDLGVSKWLALPYGAGSGPVAAKALALGHAGVLGISGGRWRVREGRSAVPRLNIPAGVSERGFDLRTSGVLNR